MGYPRGIDRFMLFAAYGEAVYHSSALEEAFAQLFALADLDHPDQRHSETIQSLLASRRRDTLGRLVRAAQNQLDLPQHISRELEPALATRNWLVHHFHRDTLALIPDGLKRAAIIRRLREIQDNYVQLNDYLLEEILRRMAQLGVSREDVERHAEELASKFSDR